MNKERLIRVEEKRILHFDWEKEVQYLADIPFDKRYVALEQELKTAFQEELLVQGGSLDRILEEGRIKDPLTGRFIDTFVKDNELEREAFEKIQKSLSEGSNLVVHFSPANLELDYKENVVDFWLEGEGEKIKYLRFFVKDDFLKLRKLYEVFGGNKEIELENDLLKNPLEVNDFKMVDILANLKTEDRRLEISKDKIDQVVGEIMGYFFDDFGSEIFVEDYLIKRIYSGIWDVIMEGRDLNEIDLGRYVSKRIDDYMYAEILGMRVKQSGGACPGVVMTAEFGKNMMVCKEGGSLVYREVNDTKGLKRCGICGFWYSGEQCPLCN